MDFSDESEFTHGILHPEEPSQNLKKSASSSSKKKDYICHICDKKLYSSSTLARHRRIHTGERPYSCDVCNVSFTDKGNLSKHKMIHTGEKPYSCDICGRAFTSNHSLKCHRRTHTGERPYNCEICNKSFTNNSDLANHKNIHAGIKPYACDLCDKSVVTKSALNQHKRMHHGVGPYACDQCPRSYVQEAQLEQHKLVHERELLLKQQQAMRLEMLMKEQMEEGFLDVSNFVKQEISETGESVESMTSPSNILHTCDICGSVFSQKIVLLMHKDVSHSESISTNIFPTQETELPILKFEEKDDETNLPVFVALAEKVKQECVDVKQEAECN